MNYLNDLNDYQRLAAEATHGPVIVLAGAGSGKTKTLITRIAHLIHLGVNPSQILAVTFTNKAAAEMKHRVSTLLQSFPRASHLTGAWAAPWMGFSPVTPEVSTFHSFCVKLLRAESAAMGFTRPFVIYDDSDQLSVVKRVLEELNINAKSDNPKRYQGAINAAKCLAQSPDEIQKEAFFGPFGEMLAKVYRRYEEILKESQSFDFGDLIVKAYQLLRDNEAIRTKYQERFQFIMVDEYQDTNRAQYLLVSLLAQKHKNLCVVGDEDQSIYRWRGADIKNILDFQKEYPDASLIKLEQNYRSTQTIIKAASHVIRNNKSRYDKTLWTANPEGEKIRVVTLADERAEAEFISREIANYLQKHPRLTFRDVAIFYRSHAQSRALEESFRKAKHPYKIIGGVGFYERKEIKDIMAYLRVLVNPDDSVSLLRIVNTPARGIGNTTIEKMEEIARNERISLFNAMRKAVGENSGVVSPGTLKKIATFTQLMANLIDVAQREPVSEIYHRILDATAYVDELKSENTEESKGRIENLEEFDTVISFFEEEAKQLGLHPEDGMLANFLNQITLESAAIEKTEESSTGFVSFMTLHSSKGLEFPLVFMVGCEEGLFPSKKSIDESDFENTAIEEERRLCYVGITRAREFLVITTAQMRRIYGQVQIAAPSRFLAEIPPELVHIEMHAATSASLGSQWSRGPSQYSGSSYGGGTKSTSGNGSRYDYSAFDDDTPRKPVVTSVATNTGATLNIGQRVRHATYGAGVIKTLEGSESERKVTIEFAGRAVKKFSLKHVELEVL